MWPGWVRVEGGREVIVVVGGVVLVVEGHINPTPKRTLLGEGGRVGFVG